MKRVLVTVKGNAVAGALFYLRQGGGECDIP